MAKLLQINNIQTGYGKKQILFGVSMAVSEGEIVAIIGPNGAGKSTLQKAVCGLLPAWRGSIQLAGERIENLIPAKTVEKGITFAPQGSRVFDELTVFENLEIGGFQLSKSILKTRIEEMLDLFPVLRKRINESAGKLSGGEQQMLAIARSLITRPKLLMLDEPSLGLSPKLVDQVFGKILEVRDKLGISILIVEQKVQKVFEIADRVYSLKLGKVAYDGTPSELKENKQKMKELFL